MAENKIGKFVASLVELFSRTVDPSGEKNIYLNDTDNLYPNRVELVERNSVTAFSASNKLKSFITGRGFLNSEYNEKIVNKKKGTSGYNFLSHVSNSLGTHRGVFVHVNYDIEGNVNYLNVLDFKKCRIAKEDAFGYPGKIYYKDWENKKKFSMSTSGSKEGRWYYPFNSDPEIVMKQRLNDVKLEKISNPTAEDLLTHYRGQVFFLNLDEMEVYPYAWLHPAYNDADNEYRISLYRNTNLRTGFLNKTILIPNGLDKETQNEFDESVREWLGAEGTSSVFVLKPGEEVLDPSKLITAVELKGSFDSKRFENDEIAVANNIRKSYLSIPKILIDPEDSFFGSSGEAFKEAIEYYNKETLFIREKIAYMMDKFYKGDFTIKELGDEQIGTTTDM